MSIIFHLASSFVLRARQQSFPRTKSCALVWLGRCQVGGETTKHRKSEINFRRSFFLHPAVPLGALRTRIYPRRSLSNETENQFTATTSASTADEA